MTDTQTVPGPWTIRQASPEAPMRLGVISPRLEFAVALTRHVTDGLHIAMSATAPEQAPAVLAACTHAVVDLYIADDAPGLSALIENSQARILLVMPDDLVESQQAEVRQVAGAHRCIREAELGAALADLAAPSDPGAATPAENPVPAAPEPAQAPAAGGWRCVAVWSLEGGIGKTRIARALGLDCARRGYRALVVGLGTPDVLPLQAGLKPEPNLLQWQRDPRAERLAELVQADGDLDLLAGFLSPLALSRFAADALDGETALRQLAMQTAHLGYAVALLDVSAQELAAPALQACNTLVLVCSATPQGAVAAVEAYRLARQEIGLVPARCHLVVNRYRAGQLTPDQFGGTVRSALRDMPDPIGVLPEQEEAGADRLARPGTEWGGADWRAALRDVGTRLFGPADSRAPLPPAEQETRFGPLVIKRG